MCKFLCLLVSMMWTVKHSSFICSAPLGTLVSLAAACGGVMLMHTQLIVTVHYHPPCTLSLEAFNSILSSNEFL